MDTIFINHLIKNQIAATIFLNNGIKLSGHISWHGDDSIILTRDGLSQVIFKRAVATIVPAQSMSIYALEEFEDGGNM